MNKHCHLGSHSKALLLLLACVLTGCETANTTADITTTARGELPIIAVTEKDMTNEYTVPAVVTALPDRAVKVTANVPGKVIRVMVVPGQYVMKGSLIAKLDNQVLTAQLAQAHASVESAAAQIQQAAGNVSSAKAQQQQAVATSETHTAAVKQAELNLVQATDNLQRQEKLFSAEVSAKKDEIIARNQVEIAKMQVVAAKSQVHVGSGQENSAKAQAAVAQAQLSAAKAQLQSAAASREQVLANLHFMDVRSPISGIVAARYLNVGDTADLNTPIVQIVDLKQVFVNASVPADDSDKIAVGNTATIYGLTGATLAKQGTVSHISPVVDAKNNSVPVMILVDNINGALKDGESVKVAVTTRVDRGAVVIPRTALVPDPDIEGHYMVYKVDDNKATRTKVEIGPSTATDVEVTTGLRAGDRIIQSGAYGLPDGTVVKERG